MKNILVASMAALLCASPIRASGGNPTFAWGPAAASAQDIVEQQSPAYFFNGGANGGAYYCTHYSDGTTHPDTCVHNPTGLVWSEDDELNPSAYGVLDPGTTSFTYGMVADNTYDGPPQTHIVGSHVLGLTLTADTPNLVMTITYQPQNVMFTFIPRLVGGRYEYRGCIMGPTPDSANLQPIPNSSGGWGVVEQIVVSTSNPTGHKQQKVSANLELWADAPGLPNTNMCQGPLGPAGTGYEQNGARWQTAL